MEKLSAVGLTQLSTQTKLFSNIQNGEIGVNNSENTSTGHPAMAPDQG